MITLRYVPFTTLLDYRNIHYVPNSDVHLPAFLSFLTNQDSLGINFNISQYPTTITKLNAIIKEARESNKKSMTVWELLWTNMKRL
jgi:hypothetical protein